MKASPLLALLSSVVLLQACASGITVLDTANTDKAALEADMRQCRDYASALDDPEPIIEAALVGGFLAGVTEWIISGGDEDFARPAALVGAIDGGASAAMGLAEEKDNVVKNCMAERGYIILN